MCAEFVHQNVMPTVILDEELERDQKQCGKYGHFDKPANQQQRPNFSAGIRERSIGGGEPNCRYAQSRQTETGGRDVPQLALVRFADVAAVAYQARFRIGLLSEILEVRSLEVLKERVVDGGEN
jgi:hypothetical protein